MVLCGGWQVAGACRGMLEAWNLGLFGGLATLGVEVWCLESIQLVTAEGVS